MAKHSRTRNERCIRVGSRCVKTSACNHGALQTARPPWMRMEVTAHYPYAQGCVTVRIFQTKLRGLFFQPTSYWLPRSTFAHQVCPLYLAQFKKMCANSSACVAFVHITCSCCTSFKVEISLYNQPLFWR